VSEVVASRFGTDETHPAKFMMAKLKEELKRFHNPTSEKTKNLFKDYVGTDVTAEWKWQHMQKPKRGRIEVAPSGRTVG
jgi:hypothetical protein